MKAVLTGETEDLVGVNLRDNNHVEHVMDVKKTDGKITAHKQDGYSDYPSDRTQAENEHVHQARRYAKWYVYRERGYETVEPHENPDSIIGAMLALAALSEEAVRDQFGDLRAQLASHYNGSSVNLPFDDADSEEIIIYRQDIYLDGDPTAADPPLADQYAEFVDDVQDATRTLLSETGNREAWFSQVLNERERLTGRLPTFKIEAVSDLHYYHSDGINEQTKWAEDPLDRAPDARIELPPLDPDTFELYRLLLGSHLSHQVRDRYLMMGLEPPEAYQQQGFGTYRGTIKQQLNDMYEKYYLASDAVGSWKGV